MSEGHGPTPETPQTPPGWAVEQPPPYGSAPWSTPGQQSPPAQTPPAQQQYAPGYGYMPPPALRPGIIPLRPLGLGDIYDGTIKLIRSNPRVMLGLSAVVAAFAAVPTAIMQSTMLRDTGRLVDGIENGDTTASVTQSSGFLESIGGPLASALVGLVAVTLLTGMIMRVLGRAVFGGKLTAGEAWRLVKGRMGALFGVTILTMVLVLAPLAVIIPVAIGTLDTYEAGLTVLALAIPYIAYVLFINSRFSFAPAVAVLEGLGPVASMWRSWKLVTGDFWRVFGILLLTSILAGVISSIFVIPFSIVGFVVAIVGGGSLGSAVVGAVVVAVGGVLGSMISYPIQSGVAGLLYTDRRMRGEAFDLVLQTAAIEQQRQGWVHDSADDLWHPSNASRL